MIKFFSFGSLFFLLACSGNPDESAGFTSLDENGDEYKKMAIAHMKKYLAEDPVEKFRLNGKQMYVMLSEVLPEERNKDIAKRAAIELNKFKNKTLRYRGVVVYVKNDSGTVAMARAE